MEKTVSLEQPKMIGYKTSPDIGWLVIILTDIIPSSYTHIIMCALYISAFLNQEMINDTLSFSLYQVYPSSGSPYKMNKNPVLVPFVDKAGPARTEDASSGMNVLHSLR